MKLVLHNWSYRTPAMGHQPRLGHDRPYRVVGLVRWWEILTILEAELGSLSSRELVASCLSFPTRLISLKSKFYNPRYSWKYKERSESNNSKMRQQQLKKETLTVQCLYSNSWTVTVQCLDSNSSKTSQ